MDINIDKPIMEKVQKLSDEGLTDRRASYFIVSYYFTQILNLTTKTVIPIPVNLYSRISIMFGLILVIFFGASIFRMLKRALLPFILIEFLFISIYLASFLMGNAETGFLLEDAFWTLAICIPMGIYIYYIKNKDIFYDVILKSSYFMTFILFIMYFFPFNESAYSMSFSSALRIPTILHINEWINTKKKHFFILFVVEAIGIVLHGSRGSFLSIGFFLLIKFILSDIKIIKKLTVIVIGAFSVTTIFYFFEKIGYFVMNFLAHKGYYSRTLSLFFSGRITHDSGRLDLFRHYMELVREKPLFGWGVLGGWIGKGLGPHNMMIEFLLAFGIFVGGAIILLLILSQFRVFFVKDKTTRDLIMVYMSLCIGLYFVSGGFLTNQNIYIYFGLMLCTFRKNSLPVKRFHKVR